MYCSQLLNLSDLLDDNGINLVFDFFKSLTPNLYDRITVSMFMRHTNLKYDKALSVLCRFYENKLLDIRYGVICPECDFRIMTCNDIAEVLDHEKYCYDCGHYFKVTDEDLILLFVMKGDLLPFVEGQHDDVLGIQSLVPSNVAPVDKISAIPRELYDLFVVNMEKQNHILDLQRSEYENKAKREEKSERENKIVAKIRRRNKMIYFGTLLTFGIITIMLLIKTVSVSNDEGEVVYLISGTAVSFIFTFLTKEITPKIFPTEEKEILDKWSVRKKIHTESEGDG